jgi:hypothetical protein
MGCQLYPIARLSTGVPVLDRKLDGGITSGSTVALCAPPASQAELSLTEFPASRPTLYLTTDRDEETVSTGFRRESSRRTPEVRYVPGDAPLDHARRLFQRSKAIRRSLSRSRIPSTRVATSHKSVGDIVLIRIPTARLSSHGSYSRFFATANLPAFVDSTHLFPVERDYHVRKDPEHEQLQAEDDGDTGDDGENLV